METRDFIESHRLLSRLADKVANPIFKVAPGKMPDAIHVGPGVIIGEEMGLTMLTPVSKEAGDLIIKTFCRSHERLIELANGN